MIEKEKKVLLSNWKFLSRNIIWTEGLENQLVESNLITTSVLSDIKGLSNREDKCYKLVEFLTVRCNQALDKLCIALQLSGHEFLAEFLRLEAKRDKGIETSEIFTKFPSVQRLPEVEKRQLVDYITEKVKEESLRDMWSNAVESRHSVLDIKEQQLLQLIKFQQESQDKERIIEELGTKLDRGKSDLVSMESEISRLQDKIVSNENTFRNKLHSQIKFSMAGESSVSRAQNRIMELEKYLDVIKMKVNNGANEGDKEDNAGVLELEVNALCDTLDRLFVRLAWVEKLQKERDHLIEERRWIILHMGFDPDVTSDLLQAYKQNAARNDENVNKLQRQMSLYAGIVRMHEEKERPAVELQESETNNNNWDSKLVDILKKDSQEMKSKLVRQSRKISALERELSTYKGKCKNLRFSLDSNVIPATNLKLTYHRPDIVADTETVNNILPPVTTHAVCVVENKKNVNPTKSRPNQRHYAFVDYGEGNRSGSAHAEPRWFRQGKLVSLNNKRCNRF